MSKMRFTSLGPPALRMSGCKMSGSPRQHQMLEPPAEGVLFAGGHGHVQGVADLLRPGRS